MLRRLHTQTTHKHTQTHTHTHVYVEKPDRHDFHETFDFRGCDDGIIFEMRSRYIFASSRALIYKVADWARSGWYIGCGGVNLLCGARHHVENIQ